MEKASLPIALSRRVVALLRVVLFFTPFSLTDPPTTRSVYVPARQVVFTPDGTRVISAGEDGLLCLYDVSQGYHPMRVMACDEPQPGRPISLSVSSNQYRNSFRLVL